MIRCSCGTHLRPDTNCPHCGRAATGTGATRTVAAALLGLAIGASGCESQAMYGVAITDKYADTGDEDRDADGYTVAGGDCDDDDAGVHPEATETVGDGVDSNCDGEDDT